MHALAGVVRDDLLDVEIAGAIHIECLEGVLILSLAKCTSR